MNQTINNLERLFNQEELREIRLKTLKDLDNDKALEKGVFYFADAIRIYRENLREYESSRDCK